MPQQVACPLCGGGHQSLYKRVLEFSYYQCDMCDFIYIDPKISADMDKGASLVDYDHTYWESELASARERSWGASLARVAEVILYCRIPILRFVDIGSGPGYLLDALSYHLPTSRDVFYGVELFPPDPMQRTTNPNYMVGTLSAAGHEFQSGCCIEVIEHLTPKMVKNLASQLAAASSPGACYIFNTGLTAYVRKEDPDYVDPLRRGHISIWSVKAVRHIFKPLSFQVHPLPGKTWAFLVEYKPDPRMQQGNVIDRIWNPCKRNLNILRDRQTGPLMHVLGIDTARAYADAPGL